MNKILLIIRRSNGDVFLSTPLIEFLNNKYPNAQIDILVNSDTVGVAKILPYINQIYTYSYDWKIEGFIKRFKSEVSLVKKIIGKYDISISLTANTRSILYARLAGEKAISCIDNNMKGSFWSRLILNEYFDYDPQRHIVEHVHMPIKALGFGLDKLKVEAQIPLKGEEELTYLPFDYSKPFLVFHPSAQYDYKIYPKELRTRLLEMLNTLNIPIAVTGGPGEIDSRISSEIPRLKNIHNLIGKTSLAGYMALCAKSMAYIGMDTLNMHIAAALNKRVFAIFGPTLIQIWSPWCNKLQRAAKLNAPVQNYGNITIFQADMPCVACGKAGCDDRHGRSDCLYIIDPGTIFNEVKKWLNESA